MFGWLAKLLIKSPVVGLGCACCEGQKEQLKKMQKAILDESLDDDVFVEEMACSPENCCNDKNGHHCSSDGKLEANTSFHYKI